MSVNSFVSNSEDGYQTLLSFLESRLPEDESFSIGMEATGHFWLALYSFLLKQGFILHVIYPIQSDSLRNFHIGFYCLPIRELHRNNNRMSKKGSPYLRRAVWMAAVFASRWDPVFKAFYDKKRSEGKSHGTETSAVENCSIPSTPF